MKTSLIILTEVSKILVYPAIAIFLYLWYFLPLFDNKEPENTITDYARIGIEAGLNAAMVKGKPTNREELDDARDYARTLVEKMYPEIKFKWPALQKPKTEISLADYASI